MALDTNLTRSTVKEARRLRSIHIVSLEWLEDSLVSSSRRPLNTAKYEFEQRKTAKSIKRRKILKGTEEGDGHQSEWTSTRNSALDAEESVKGVTKGEGKHSAGGAAGKKQRKRKSDDPDGVNLSKDERVEISGAFFPSVDDPYHFEA